MESERLWTFLTIMPHIDTKKINTPAKLYPFPWDDKTDNKDEINKPIDQNEFDEMMKKSTDLIEKINNQKNNI